MAALYFIHLPGCAACAAAVGPVVEAVRRLQAERPGGLKAYPVDLSTVDWKAQKWLPRVTPTLLLLRDGKGFDPQRDVLEGQKSSAEIYRWVKGGL